MALLKVLICDDRRAPAEQAVSEARTGAGDGVEVVALYGGDLAEAIRQVSRAARSPADNSMTTPFDAYDIVICDNNLSHLNDLGVVITAESIIGNIRAFSKCGYIVSLNKRPDVDFDLEFLFGDSSSVADLAINRKHLRISELWTGSINNASGFLPWYWPTLKRAPMMRRAQIAEIRRSLDNQVLRHFGFSAAAKAALSDRAIGTISLVGQRATRTKTHDTSKVTFKSFFRDTARTLPSDDRSNLLRQGRTEVIARVVASELESWLRRDVLAPQDALVDIPHLLMRMPFLLGGDAAKISDWNRAVAVSREPFGMSATLYSKHLKRRRFKRSNWLEKPAFFWPDIKLDATLAKRFFSPGNQSWGDFVFCEDTRFFRNRLPSSEEGMVQEFASGLDGPWSRRYVERLLRFDYAPLVLLAR